MKIKVIGFILNRIIFFPQMLFLGFFELICDGKIEIWKSIIREKVEGM